MPEQIQVERPALFGGISTQPPHLRQPGQVEDAENVAFSVQFGAMKRNGTKFMVEVGNLRISCTSVANGPFVAGNTITQSGGKSGVILSVVTDGSTTYLTIRTTAGTFAAGTVNSGSTSATAAIQSQWASGDKIRFYATQRDSSERYLWILSAGGLPRIYPLNGTEGIVEPNTGAETYFASGSPTADDYRITTAADFSLVANTKVLLAGNNTAGTLTATTFPFGIARTSISPLKFVCGVQTWKARGSRGTNTTNPLFTSFDGTRAIADLVVHRERLFFGINNRIVASQTGDFFDFWYDLATAGSVVATDPIDVSLPGSLVNFVDRFAAFRKGMVVFCKSSKQFQLSSPDTLEPGTVSFTESTSYSSISLPLATLGNRVVFATASKDSGIVYQYYYDDTQVSNTAENVSEHVVGLIPRDIEREATSSIDGTTAILTASHPDTLYVHKEYWVANQRVQSAWSKFKFDHLDRICDIAIIDSTVFILAETTTANQFVVESMNLGTSLQLGTSEVTPSDATYAPESDGDTFYLDPLHGFVLPPP
jgi:hypothetical protein